MQDDYMAPSSGASEDSPSIVDEKWDTPREETVHKEASSSDFLVPWMMMHMMNQPESSNIAQSPAHLSNPSTQLFRTNGPAPISKIGAPALTKEETLATLDKYYLDALKYSNWPSGSKNLIYFTLNADDNYIKLFSVCLRSIIKHSGSASFDVLVICDDATKVKVQALGLPIDINFMRVQTPADGIAASMNKLLIYQWSKVQDYGKILFLDVDIIATASVGAIFSTSLNPDKLYAAIHRFNGALHANPFHRVVEYPNDKLEAFASSGIFAFNAGQFLMVNSKRMMRHFTNVHWFSRSWPGEYFFEQTYMNHYFNWNLISDVHVLSPKIKFMAVHAGAEADLDKGTKKDFVLTHFVGHACDAAKKLDFMRAHPMYKDYV